MKITRMFPLAAPLLVAGFAALSMAQVSRNEAAKKAAQLQAQASSVYGAGLYIEFYGLPNTTFDRINEKGTVIGTWTPYTGVSPRAFLLYTGTEEIIQLFVPQSDITAGLDVDDNDVALFSSYDKVGFEYQFQGNFSWTKKHGYRAAKGPEAQRMLINDKGFGVLQDLNNSPHGARVNLHSGKYEALPTPQGFQWMLPFDINAGGDIIGYVGNPIQSRYILWGQNNKPVDLGPAPQELTFVNINDNGQFALPTPLGVQLYDGPNKPSALVPVPLQPSEVITSVHLTNVGDLYVNVQAGGFVTDTLIRFQGDWYRATNIMDWTGWQFAGVGDANASGQLVGVVTNFYSRVAVIGRMRKINASP